jgi:AraC-like DNA-binding protein
MIDLFQKYHIHMNECHDFRYPLPDKIGHGYFRSICPRKGIWLFLENYQLSREFSVKAGSTVLPLGISYCLSGRVDWAIEGRDEQFTTRKGQSELILAGQVGGVSVYRADEPVVLVNIMICPRLMKTYLDLNFDLEEDNILASRLDGKTNDFFYRKYEIPLYIQHVLNQLMRSPCEFMSDRLFLQSKVMELMAFQMERCNISDRTSRNAHETASTTALISNAKAILRSQIKSPPSLKGLAHELGTNETKLKKIFKETCGTTVYGYLTDCRMQEACELLKDDSLTMADIGAELGYSERTHFCRAFSRYHGMPPSQYRYKLQQRPCCSIDQKIPDKSDR